MLKPFDYIFYRVETGALKTWDGTSRGFVGKVYVIMLQWVLLMGLVFIPLRPFVHPVLNPWDSVVLVILLMTIAMGNSYRYKRVFTYEMAIRLWGGEGHRRKVLLRWVIVTAYVVSYALLFVIPAFVMPAMLSLFE